MEEVSKKIGEKIKQLDLNNENPENYHNFMDSSINSLINFCNENGAVPFLSFVACNCGCGVVYHIGNKDILPKQQVASFLEAAAKQIRESNKNVN